jgi:hypothetical protein
VKRKRFAAGENVDVMMSKLAAKIGLRAKRKKLGVPVDAPPPTSDQRAIEAVYRRAKAKEAMTLRRRKREPWS